MSTDGLPGSIPPGAAQPEPASSAGGLRFNAIVIGVAATV